MTERDVSPHAFTVWKSLKAMSMPGDVLRTSLRPPDGETSHAAWLKELSATLDQGIEIFVEEAGSLRHGSAVLRALQQTMAEHEQRMAQREHWAEADVAEAKAELETEFKRGYEAGMRDAGLAQKAAEERQRDRDRKREERRRAAQEQAEHDVAARSNPSSPHYMTSAA